MKKTVLTISLYCLLGLFQPPALHGQSITSTGYPEHFLAGALIGGTVTHFAYQKNQNKFKARAMGMVVTTGLGLMKEVLDPVLFNRYRDAGDFGYTVLGGAVGVTVVIPLTRKREKTPKSRAGG